MKNLKNLGRGDLAPFREKWKKKVQFIKECYHHLTEWERDFIKGDVKRRLESNRNLTMQQSITLDNIYAKVILKEPIKEPPV